MTDKEGDLRLEDKAHPIWQLGGAWLSTAEMLKKAADRLLINYQRAYQHFSEQTSSATSTGAWTEIQMPPDLDLYCPYMLLIGYAIENLIKGIIVCGSGIIDPNFDGKVNFEDFRTTNRDNGEPWGIAQHGFLNLLKAATIKKDLFVEDELLVLQYLDKIVMWGGRYPVPKKEDRKMSSGIVCAEPPYIGKQDVLPIPTVESVYNKALKEMHEICMKYGQAQK